MDKILIGVNLPKGTTLDNFEMVLEKVKDFGFDAVEINISAFNIIIGGKIATKVLDYVKNIMDKSGLLFTAHASYFLDLRNLEHRKMHLDVLLSSIEICSILGIKVFNIHFEEYSNKEELEEAYKEAIKLASDFAKNKDVLLVIENIEIEKMQYVTDFVRELNAKNVKINVDLGHLYLSSKYYNYDYFKALEDCKSLVNHIHINDNTGDFEMMRVTNYDLYNTLNINGRITFGRGDIHLPPFWGEVPIKKSLEILKNSGYNGIYICEYNSELYNPFNKEICKEIRAFIESI